MASLAPCCMHSGISSNTEGPPRHTHAVVPDAQPWPGASVDLPWTPSSLALDRPSRSPEAVRKIGCLGAELSCPASPGFLLPSCACEHCCVLNVWPQASPWGSGAGGRPAWRTPGPRGAGKPCLAGRPWQPAGRGEHPAPPAPLPGSARQPAIRMFRIGLPVMSSLCWGPFLDIK